MYKISGEVIKFNENTMRNWTLVFTEGGKGLTEMKIESRILQADALSPSLFVIAIIPVTRILRKMNWLIQTPQIARKKSTN